MRDNPSGGFVLAMILLATLLGGLLLADDSEEKKKDNAKSAGDEPVVASPSDLVGEAGDESSKESSVDARVETEADAEGAEELPPARSARPASQSEERNVTRQDILASVTIFVLAVIIGFEVIAKVPPTLHTPLMSGSNAISGITLVGAVIVAASFSFSGFVGFLAVTLATINAVGGFLVTHRMLAMFKKR